MWDPTPCVPSTPLEYTLNALSFHPRLPTKQSNFHCKIRKGAISTRPPWVPRLFLLSLNLHFPPHYFFCTSDTFFACFSWLRNISETSSVSLFGLFSYFSLLFSIFIMSSHFAVIRQFPKTSYLLPSACFSCPYLSASSRLFPPQAVSWWCRIKMLNFQQHWNRHCVPEAFEKKVGWHPNIARVLWLGKLHLFSH